MSVQDLENLEDKASLELRRVDTMKCLRSGRGIADLECAAAEILYPTPEQLYPWDGLGSVAPLSFSWRELVSGLPLIWFLVSLPQLYLWTWMVSFPQDSGVSRDQICTDLVRFGQSTFSPWIWSIDEFSYQI